MINSIQCVDFQDVVMCKSAVFTSRETFLQLNYTFFAGKVYGIVSDFGCGSWGIVTGLGGRTSECFTGSILLNGIQVRPSDLLKYSAFVGEKVFSGINSSKELLTPKECIEKALSTSKSKYSVAEIKDMFCLSNERFNRDLNCVSGEINRISIAVNFALNKEVFCFPWLNEHDILCVSTPILEVLKMHKKIVLIPTSQKATAKKISDRLIVLERGKLMTH